jgi:hypothetical protein
MFMALDILNAVLIEKGLLEEEKEVVTGPAVPQTIPYQDEVFSGNYFAGDSGVINISFDMEENTVTGTIRKDGTEIPVFSLFYNDGCYYDGKGTLYYFTTVNSQDYLVTTLSELNLDAIALQKLAEIENPQELRVDINGKQWLRRNVKPFEGAMLYSTHVVQSSLPENLPGYVDFLGPKPVQSSNFARMPVNNFRDLTELTLFDNEGQLWAHVSDFLYSSAENAGIINHGDNGITIGNSGYNEWLKAESGLILSFEYPDGGRILAFSPDGEVVYDSAMDKGDVYIMEGGLIEMAGLPGDSFKVTAIE